MKLAPALVAGALALGVTSLPARAEVGELITEILDIEAPGHWRLMGTPGMEHWNRSPPEPYKHVWGLGIERQREDGWLYGAAYFSNSFGQDCGYWYLGRQYFGLFEMKEVFLQWTAGLLYGYKGQYAARVPLNYKAFSPGFVAAVGWQFNPQYSAQINVVSDAGLMLQLSYDWR